jgi:3-hydroxyisobutyrate dehydrogenase-like beta-hydroxyacid dehydrogenase
MTVLRSIHVLGVGKMGLPMATLLHNAGYEVTVSDVSSERLDRAAERSLKIVHSQVIPAEAKVLVSSIPDDAALLAIASQVALQATKGATWIDTSTVSPTASAQAALICDQAGISYLRCTVSGNNHMMEAAQVTVMASGPKAVFDSLESLLKCFGPTVFYLGDAEQSRLMKLVINLMIVQTSAMLGEALSLGEKGGLDWQSMWQVISASAVGSPIVKAKAVQLSQRDYTPTFTVPQMLKDMDLMLGEANRLHVPLPQTSLTRQAMMSALANGFAEQDYAAVIKVAELAAGLKPV